MSLVGVSFNYLSVVIVVFGVFFVGFLCGFFCHRALFVCF